MPFAVYPPAAMPGRPASIFGSKRAVALAADGSGGAWGVPADNQWCEVLVVWDSTVSAGDVTVYRVESDPDNGLPLRVSVGVLDYATYNATGGRLLLHVPPGCSVLAQLGSYAGTGLVRAVFSTWAER